MVDQLQRLLAGNQALDAAPTARLCGFLIAHAHHHVRDQARARLAELGLDSRKLGALAVINEHQPCSQQVLANRLAVSALVTAEVVEELAADGLVERVRHATDRRRYDLTLTTMGSERLRSGARVAGDIDAELARRLTPSGVAELHRLLAKLLDHPSADVGAGTPGQAVQA